VLYTMQHQHSSELPQGDMLQMRQLAITPWLYLRHSNILHFIKASTY
jgi:hypothetical protein